MSNHNIVQNVSTASRNLTGAGVTFTALSGPFDAREVYAIVRYDGVTGPVSGSVHTLSFAAIGAAAGYGTDVAWGQPISFNPTASQCVPTQKFLMPAINNGGTFAATLKSNNAGDTAVNVGFSIIDASSITQERFETELGYTATVAGRIDAAISSVSGGGGGSTWTGLFPPREMSGDRIGFSHPDSGTFYYLINNAADSTPTTFTGTAAGSTRSVLRTTVASDIADGFTVLTVYKQVGGSVVHADDTPVGAILVNKTSGTVTERLLTQTELDAIRTANLGGGGPYVDDPVPTGRLAQLRRTTSGLVASGANGITLKVGDTSVLCGASFARDLPTNARVTSITSVTPSAAGITATAVGVDHAIAKFTVTAVTAGTYTLAVLVTYSQGGGTVAGTITVKVVS